MVNKKKIETFRGRASSALGGFHADPPRGPAGKPSRLMGSILVKVKFGVLVFEEEAKPKNLEIAWILPYSCICCILTFCKNL